MTCDFKSCRSPAHWLVGGWWACEGHSLAALRNGSDEVTGPDGEPMALDEAGELTEAP